MPDRTGIARGTLRPIIYYERQDGYVIVAAYEADHPEQAKWVFEQKYKALGWMMKETGNTLAAVDEFQKRLVAQEIARSEKMAVVNEAYRSKIHEMSGAILRSKMIASDTSSWERDFIRAYFKLRNEKRDKYRDHLAHHNFFLWARENESATKVEDGIPLLPGQFERKNT